MPPRRWSKQPSHCAIADRMHKRHRAGGVRQRHGFATNPRRETFGSHIGQRRHGLEGETLSGLPSHLVHVAAIIGADIDGFTGSRLAHEFEQCARPQP